MIAHNDLPAPPAVAAAASAPAPASDQPARLRWEPPRLTYIAHVDEVAMPSILKTGSISDGGGTFKAGIG